MNFIMGAIFIFQVVNIELLFELVKVKLRKTSALNQIKHYDETIKRAHGYKHQHCEPELKRITSKTTVGQRQSSSFNQLFLAEH